MFCNSQDLKFKVTQYYTQLLDHLKWSQWPLSMRQCGQITMLILKMNALVRQCFPKLWPNLRNSRSFSSDLHKHTNLFPPYFGYDIKSGQFSFGFMLRLIPNCCNFVPKPSNAIVWKPETNYAQPEFYVSTCTRYRRSYNNTISYYMQLIENSNLV